MYNSKKNMVFFYKFLVNVDLRKLKKKGCS